MKTKSCPFCAKEISDEAIICKFCHRLLIDENGNDIQPEPEVPAEEPAETPVHDTAEDDKTIVYSKDELKKAMSAISGSDSEQEVPEAEDGEEFADDAEYDDAEGYDYAEDDTAEEQEGTYDDDDFADAEYAVEDYDPKRTFIITAIITVGILIVIIAAICVGYKLFGLSDDETTSSGTLTPKTTTTQPQESTDENTESVEEYVPQVTDDTTSDDPEEIANSSLEDSVADSASDSSSDSSSTDSDSSADSSTDSSDDSSTESSDDSSVAPSDGDPGFEPAGSYYDWNEAHIIIANYFTANGMTGSYSYSYGTDGVEMVFAYYDDYGTSYYRVDLITGAVSAI